MDGRITRSAGKARMLSRHTSDIISSPLLLSFHSYLVHSRPQLLGTSAESYAREVTFVIPSTSAAEETSPPQILVSSINMSLKDFLTCHERISYTAFSPKKLQEGAGQAVEMTTIAEISAQGKLKNGGMAARKLGRKMEDYSIERWVHVEAWA